MKDALDELRENLHAEHAKQMAIEKQSLEESLVQKFEEEKAVLKSDHKQALEVAMN